MLYSGTAAKCPFSVVPLALQLVAFPLHDAFLTPGKNMMNMEITERQNESTSTISYYHCELPNCYETRVASCSKCQFCTAVAAMKFLVPVFPASTFPKLVGLAPQVWQDTARHNRSEYVQWMFCAWPCFSMLQL